MRATLIAADKPMLEGTGRHTKETMRSLAEDLNAPYVSERSFKLSHHELLGNRLLMSFHIRSLGANPDSALAHICRTLNVPSVYRAMIEAKFYEADNIHLGYEEGLGAFVCKLYLEFAGRFRRSFREPDESCAPVLLHLAFKWDPNRDSLRTTARYTCTPRLTPADMERRLSEFYGNRTGGVPHRAASRLLQQATQRMPAESLFFLEVEEDDNPRRSFDMCLYDAGFSMDEIEPELAAIVQYFQIPPSRFRQIFDPVRHEKLGHLSGGVGRNGREFCTFYYGARRHLPARPREGHAVELSRSW